MCDQDTICADAGKSALYERLTRQIEREEKLINNRLGWMLTAEGFMFAAMALLDKSGQGTRLIAAIADVIPVVGGLIAVATLIGVWGAHLSKQEYRRIYTAELADSPNVYPRPFGGAGAHIAGIVPNVVLPTIILLAWLKIWLVVHA